MKQCVLCGCETDELFDVTQTRTQEVRVEGEVHETDITYTWKEVACKRCRNDN